MTAVILLCRALAALFALVLAAAATAAPPGPDADRIMQRAFEVYGGDDSFSRLRFSFEYDGGKTAALSVVMAYKRYPASAGVESKVIMFSESPPDRKDIAYLGWFYRPEQDRGADQWLYLPELRQTRKLTRRSHDRAGAALDMKRRPEGDEFSVSELDEEELAPRDPRLDRHALLSIETLDGRPVHAIESVPLKAGSSSYGKFVTWITQDGSLPLRVDYYNRHLDLVKTLTFNWAQVDKAWVWERVTAVNPLNGNRTVLEQADVRVNIGLPDEMFSKRMLDQGGDVFAQRVAGHAE
jgi:hypothetical protein